MATDKPRRRSRRRQRDPGGEPWRRFLWKGRSDPEAVAHAKESYARHQMFLSIRRKFVAVSGQAKLCRRGACRRAGVCSGDECLRDMPPVEETPEDLAALKALRDALKAHLAAAKAAED